MATVTEAVTALRGVFELIAFDPTCTRETLAEPWQRATFDRFSLVLERALGCSDCTSVAAFQRRLEQHEGAPQPEQISAYEVDFYIATLATEEPEPNLLDDAQRLPFAAYLFSSPFDLQKLFIEIGLRQPAVRQEFSLPYYPRELDDQLRETTRLRARRVAIMVARPLGAVVGVAACLAIVFFLRGGVTAGRGGNATQGLTAGIGLSHHSNNLRLRFYNSSRALLPDDRTIQGSVFVTCESGTSLVRISTNGGVTPLVPATNVFPEVPNERSFLLDVSAADCCLLALKGSSTASTPVLPPLFPGTEITPREVARFVSSNYPGYRFEVVPLTR